MKQKYGKLVWTDVYDQQQPYVKEGTVEFLEEMGVTEPEQEIEQITDVFMNNGQMRGRIFYNRSFHSRNKKNGSLRLPVYGVKGAHREKSISNYTHWYISKEEEMLGTGFSHIIFESHFGTEDEYRTLKEPEEFFREQQDFIMTDTKKTQGLPFIHAVGKLWEVMEKDPSARFVIVLPKSEGSLEEAEKRAEEESMDILRQIYLMIPQRLRLTIGFATGVTTEEIIKLANLPIHLFITDGDSDLTVLNNANFIYHIFRIEAEEEYTYDKEKQEMLKKLLNYNSEGLLEELLDKSEEEYLRKNDKAIGFDAYKEILDLFVVPWYEKDKEHDLSRLLQYRESQESVLECRDLEDKWRMIFLGKILPQTDYGCQLADYMIYNPNKMKDVIGKSKDKLGLGFLIDAIQKTIDIWNKICKKANDEQQKTIQKLQAEKKENVNCITKLEATIKEKEEQITGLNTIIKEREEQITGLNTTIEKKVEQITGLNGEIQQKENSISNLEGDKQELSSLIQVHENNIRNLKEEKEDLQKTNQKLKQDNVTVKKELAGKKENEELIVQCMMTITDRLKKDDINVKELQDIKDDLKKQQKELENIKDAIKEQEKELSRMKEQKGLGIFFKSYMQRRKERIVRK